MSTVTAEQTLKITRRIKAPRERVFAAFTNADSIRQWFGPGPVKVVECTADFRVGGSYRIKARSPEAAKMSSSPAFIARSLRRRKSPTPGNGRTTRTG